MNGNLIVLDTNIVLYILGRQFDLASLPEGHYCISVVSEIELLSYPDLSPDEETSIKDFLSAIDIIELTSLIKEKTIEFRKKFVLKIPDAIIAATAFSMNAHLITNDKKLSAIFEKI